MSRPSSARQLRATLPRVDGWSIAFVALFLARFFVPAEGVIEGQTQWIVCAWLALAALWCFAKFRSESERTPSFGLLDLSVAALVAGHAISAVVALLGESNARATLNSLWEWIGVGVAWWLMRQVCASETTRQLLLRSVLLCATALSALGVWQHYVWYPQLARDFRELSSLQDKLRDMQLLTAQEQQRFTQLSREMGDVLFTTDVSGRSMLTDRAAASTEPIGLFALANTFAAIIFVGLLLDWDEAWRNVQTPRRWRAVVPWICVASLLAWCLLLSKSRSAYVAACCGGAAWAWLSFGRATIQRSQIFLGVLIATAVAVCASGVAWLTGGLDWEVLSEAPKSLGYRMQYWRATVRMIWDSPWWGVGPGNFQTHYLRYKLAGGGEDIRDPHNFLLDAWANAGLLAVAGAFLLAWGVLRNLWRGRLQTPGNLAAAPLSATLMCGLAALALVASQQFLFESQLDPRLLAVAGVFVVAGLGLFGGLANSQRFGNGGAAAALALLVHLLGSGGMEMPVIVLLWVSLAASAAPPSTETASQIPLPPRSLAVLGFTSAAALGLAMWTGLIPVMTSNALMLNGKSAWLMNRDFRLAITAFKEAAQADPLSPDPWYLLAQTYHAQWLASPGDASLFDAAVESQREGLRRDPLSIQHQVTVAEWWLERFRRDPQPRYTDEAATVARSVVEIFPQLARAQAALALALAAAGRTDPELISLALRLDAENHKYAQHDKYLGAQRQLELERALDLYHLRQEVREARRQGREPRIPQKYVEIFGWDKLLNGIPER